MAQREARRGGWLMRTCALVASLGLAVATHAAPALAQTGQKPSDGTTASQPFAAGTGESATSASPLW